MIRKGGILILLRITHSLLLRKNQTPSSAFILSPPISSKSSIIPNPNPIFYLKVTTNPLNFINISIIITTILYRPRITTAMAHHIKRSKTPSKGSFTQPNCSTYSPAKTIGKKGSNETQNNLKMALEMIESHQKEALDYRGKWESANKTVDEQKGEIFELKKQVESLNKENEMITKKYKKAKLRYRKSQLQQQEPPKTIDREQGKGQARTDNETLTNQIPHQNKVINQQNEILRSQLAHKNKVINKLCTQVQQCQQNTMNIIKIINILEQKVQELTMDNTLLRGIVYEKNRYHTSSNNSKQL